VVEAAEIDADRSGFAAQARTDKRDKIDVRPQRRPARGNHDPLRGEIGTVRRANRNSFENG
jgi:hypothetical protein